MHNKRVIKDKYRFPRADKISIVMILYYFLFIDYKPAITSKQPEFSADKVTVIEPNNDEAEKTFTPNHTDVVIDLNRQNEAKDVQPKQYVKDNKSTSTSDVDPPHLAPKKKTYVDALTDNLSIPDYKSRPVLPYLIEIKNPHSGSRLTSRFVSPKLESDKISTGKKSRRRSKKKLLPKGESKVLHDHNDHNAVVESAKTPYIPASIDTSKIGVKTLSKTVLDGIKAKKPVIPNNKSTGTSVEGKSALIKKSYVEALTDNLSIHDYKSHAALPFLEDIKKPQSRSRLISHFVSPKLESAKIPTVKSVFKEESKVLHDANVASVPSVSHIKPKRSYLSVAKFNPIDTSNSGTLSMNGLKFEPYESLDGLTGDELKEAEQRNEYTRLYNESIEYQNEQNAEYLKRNDEILEDRDEHQYDLY